MRDNRLKKLVNAALFAALICVSTIAVQIPSPMNGYVNPGDGFVLLAGYILGPVWGGAAAGLGSMLADLFTGYGHYAPGTLLIKGLMALLAGSFYRMGKGHSLSLRLLGGLLAEVFMVLGYFLYASLLLGRGLAAAASIPGNLMQAFVGLLISNLLLSLLQKSRVLEKLQPDKKQF